MGDAPLARGAWIYVTGFCRHRWQDLHHNRHAHIVAICVMFVEDGVVQHITHLVSLRAEAMWFDGDG